MNEFEELIRSEGHSTPRTSHELETGNGTQFHTGITNLPGH